LKLSIQHFRFAASTNELQNDREDSSLGQNVENVADMPALRKDYDYDSDSDFEDDAEVEDLNVTPSNAEGAKADPHPNAMEVINIPDTAYKT
jgi:hypothetical protein